MAKHIIPESQDLRRRNYIGRTLQGGEAFAANALAGIQLFFVHPVQTERQMAPSQLKQLKSSLREHGLTGPPRSKKQKKQGAKDQEKRLQRNAALHSIRERFNPFEVKASVRGNKYSITTNRSPNGASAKGVQARPGVTKSLGEERVGLPTSPESDHGDVDKSSHARDVLLCSRRYTVETKSAVFSIGVLGKMILHLHPRREL